MRRLPILLGIAVALLGCSHRPMSAPPSPALAVREAGELDRGRMLERTALLGIEVPELAPAEREAERIVVGVEGFVAR